MNRYEEEANILAVMTKKVDRYGRVAGLKDYRGRTVRVLVLHDEVRSLEKPPEKKAFRL